MATQAELAEIQERYRVRAREWLELEIEYEGRGKAEFSSNPGTIRGPMTIQYDEDGTAAAFAMTVEELIAEQQPFGPDELFVFVNALPLPGGTGYGFGGSSNKCTHVELTGDGVVVAAAQRSDVMASAGNQKATFRPYRTIARFETAAQPRYWAVPLLNFTSGFFHCSEELHDHPLRTRETSRYEPVAEGAIYHQLAHQQGNSLIPFMYEGELGFIEPLPDYSARQRRVEAGETVATAVMVGSVPAGFDPATDPEWFPTDLITLLGLATGRGVAVPFVELRGPAGQLVARLHAGIGRSTGEQRRGLIEEAFNRSTGEMLSAFLGSEHSRQPWLRVALRHLLSTLTGDMTVEDRLAHLFRTIECLCAGLGLNASRPLELSDVVREDVLHELNECVDGLQVLLERVTPPDSDRIRALTSRLREVEANRPSFPTQLVELIDHAGLPDANWLRDFHFRTRIGGGPTRWASAAGQYRNRIFHSGFIDFEKFEVDNAVRFISHLSDVLVRVIFGLIGFDGQYKPPCGAHGMRTHEKPDWPRGATLSAEFFLYVD